MGLAPFTLTGRAVRLEPLTVAHVPALWAVAREAELWRWTVSQVHSEADLRQYVDEALAAQAEGTALPFTIVAGDPAGGREEVAGSTRFGAVDLRHRRVEIGWTWIGRRWQRTAVNTECKYLLLRHAFETLGCVRVEFKTDALNEPSRRALARIGALEEGTLRRHMITETGRLRDTVYFSIIAEEWPAVQRRLEHILSR